MIEVLHEAENAYFRLQQAQPGASIRFAVDYYLANHATVVIDLTADEALEKFNAARRARKNEEITIKTSATVIQKFFNTQGISLISDITPDKVRAFVTDATLADRTVRDRHGILNNFSNYLQKNRHLAANLVAHLDRPNVKNDGVVTYLTVAQCQRLLDLAATEPAGRKRIRGAMLPYFAHCMLSGLRPDEVQRMRPDWNNHSFFNGVITGFRAKTQKPRHVELHGELPGILQQCQAASLAPGYFSRKAFERIQELAGLKAGDSPSLWANDILRHSYASHHCALNQNLDSLVKNMGNSEDVLHQSYLNMTALKAEGANYFKMRPANTLPSEA